MAQVTHQTGQVIIPPPTAWPPIQAIRAEHDRKLRRRMPHITPIYPFPQAGESEAVALAVRRSGLRSSGAGSYRARRRMSLTSQLDRVRGAAIHIHLSFNAAALGAGVVAFEAAATLGVAAGAAADPQGDAEEPAGGRLATADRPGAEGQGEEGALGGVLGVVGVAQLAAAGAEDHQPVPLDQRRERGGGGAGRPGDEPAEQLAVGLCDRQLFSKKSHGGHAGPLEHAPRFSRDGAAGAG